MVECFRTLKRVELLILSCLRRDARMKLTDMSRATRVPVSTIFDKIVDYRERGVVERCTALVRFEKFGFQARAIVTLACRRKDRDGLRGFLERHPNVNSLFKINNGWDFMVEAVFHGVKEVEDFLDDIDEQVRLTKKEVYYLIEEIRKEEFLACPQRERLLQEGAG